MNFAFVLPLIFCPEWILGLFGITVNQLIWPRFAGLLLGILSIFYIPATLDIDRYRVFAWLAVFLPTRSARFSFSRRLRLRPADRLSRRRLPRRSVGIATLFCLLRILPGSNRTSPKGDRHEARLSGNGFSPFWSCSSSARALFFLLFRLVAQPRTNDLAEVFNHGSIGNEEAQGIPYWIWRVLPQLFPNICRQARTAMAPSASIGAPATRFRSACRSRRSAS